MFNKRKLSDPVVFGGEPPPKSVSPWVPHLMVMWLSAAILWCLYVAVKLALFEGPSQEQKVAHQAYVKEVQYQIAKELVKSVASRSAYAEHQKTCAKEHAIGVERDRLVEQYLYCLMSPKWSELSVMQNMGTYYELAHEVYPGVSGQETGTWIKEASKELSVEHSDVLVKSILIWMQEQKNKATDPSKEHPGIAKELLVRHLAYQQQVWNRLEHWERANAKQTTGWARVNAKKVEFHNGRWELDALKGLVESQVLGVWIDYQLLNSGKAEQGAIGIEKDVKVQAENRALFEAQRWWESIKAQRELTAH